MTSGGPLLFVGAHPDDETFCAGGVLNQAARDGCRVVCVTATHGERGSHDEQRWPAAQLAEVRTRELEAALSALGVSEHHWLGCQDGSCNRCERGECQQRLSELVRDVRPVQIITLGQTG
ncbi:PIG-L family deacetylase [Patescibacteria group bacterium]|nr:MAG: PIG-L family deacetylase [Patescibacteria group bacterium]